MRLFIISLLLVLTTSFTAHATNSFFYVGAAAHDQTVRVPNFYSGETQSYADTEFATSEEGSPYRLFTGYQFNNFFALEAGFTDYLTKSFTLKSTDNASRVNLAGTSESISLDFTSVLNIPMSNNFAFKAKLGATIWQNDIDLLAGDSSNPALESDSSTGTSLKSGLGATYAFNSRFAIMFDWDNRKVFDRNVETYSLGIAISL